MVAADDLNHISTTFHGEEIYLPSFLTRTLEALFDSFPEDGFTEFAVSKSSTEDIADSDPDTVPSF